MQRDTVGRSVRCCDEAGSVAAAGTDFGRHSFAIKCACAPVELDVREDGPAEAGKRRRSSSGMSYFALPGRVDRAL